MICQEYIKTLVLLLLLGIVFFLEKKTAYANGSKDSVIFVCPPDENIVTFKPNSVDLDSSIVKYLDHLAGFISNFPNFASHSSLILSVWNCESEYNSNPYIGVMRMKNISDYLRETHNIYTSMVDHGIDIYDVGVEREETIELCLNPRVIFGFTSTDDEESKKWNEIFEDNIEKCVNEDLKYIRAGD